MSLIRPATLVLALLMAGPALWQAFVTGGLDVTSALGRFLIAVPVAAAMVWVISLLTESYRKALAAREQAALDARIEALAQSAVPAPAEAAAGP